MIAHEMSSARAIMTVTVLRILFGASEFVWGLFMLHLCPGGSEKVAIIWPFKETVDTIF
jgi:hypothetical protein